MIKSKSSLVYDAIRSKLPVYERNLAWAKSREIQLDHKRDQQAAESERMMPFTPDIVTVDTSSLKPHREFYRVSATQQQTSCDLN